jgi:hypothetical protein
MMFEKYSRPVLPWKQFLVRILRFTFFTLVLLGISLGIGVLGYHYLNELPWLDALVNAAMILGGMGPVDGLKNDAAKWFASAYAIFSGIAFLSTVAVFLAPITHRFLHKHHLDDDV